MSLSLIGVTFAYPGASRTVLNSIDLRIEPGESVALMGASGRGKTTLLNVAGLLIAPTSGVVEVEGKATSITQRASLGIGWILQSVNLLPRRSARDNVMLPALAAGTPAREAEARADELLRSVGLDPTDERHSRTLSGGEAQRVGLARALITKPSVLLADEPTANLDGATAQSMADMLFSAASNTALLLATHDEAIGGLADRVVRMQSDGTLAED